MRGEPRAGNVRRRPILRRAWLGGDALIEFIGRFGLGQQIVLALLMTVAAPRCRDTRLSALGQSG